MSYNYSRRERLIAKILSKAPLAKSLIKKLYQVLNFWIYRKNYTFNSDFDVFELSYHNLETFFGYYDKSPLNSTNEFIIYHASTIPTRLPPNPYISNKIVLFDFLNKSICAEFETKAYNWQQGSKLQWISDYLFIYNDYENDQYVSKIVDSREKRIIKVINSTIYDVFGTKALSLNYDRLALLRRDYGYFNNLKKIKIDVNDLAGDGIFSIDLNNNSSELLISFQSVINVNYKPEMKGAKHKINHIMISPKGDKFIFMHRYFVSGRKFDRLFLANIDGTSMKLISDHEMVSHYSWISNNTIIAYMRRYDLGDKYYTIDLDKLEITTVGEGVIDIFGDGHPSVKNQTMIFDTYPNKSRMKELFAFSFASDKLMKIGEFFEPLKYSDEMRCDLHPKWSENGSYIFFESVHSGVRKLYYVEYK